MSTPVEKIKERLTIEDVVSSYIKLEKSGKNLKAKCPFHNEKTASFYVSPDRGSYYCFGCGAKGDIFTFVEQFEGLDFMGSLRMLAEKAGIPLVFEKIENKSEKERLYMIMEEATVFFEKILSDSSEANEYLKKRGLKTETIKYFRIGFVPNEWRLLYTHLKNKKYSDVEIEKAGLAKKPEPKEGNKETTYYDRFRGRVIFPIMDSSGRVIAFSGRILHDDGKSAKYLNSPDMPLYNKSTVLYGIDKAKQYIRSQNYTILVEGQIDLVLSHQSGIRNTVAVSGTALSDTTTSKENVINNLGIVRRLSPNIILAFDSDEAGRKAAMRSAGIALSLGMDVKIALMPEGKDPADMILYNIESWKDVLRKALPIVEFQINTVMNEVKSKNLDLRKIPPLIREKVLPFIISIGGSMEKSYFIKMIHDKTGLSEESVREDIINLTKTTKENQALQPTTTNDIVYSNAKTSRLEQIIRKLFGLLAYLKESDKTFDTTDAYSVIKSIAGEDRYNNLIKNMESYKDETILEAEIYFGQIKPDNKEKIKSHLDELLLNFEEDIVKDDLGKAFSEITRIEKEGMKNKDTEERKAVLMNTCQILSNKLSEISKKRKL